MKNNIDDTIFPQVSNTHNKINQVNLPKPLEDTSYQASSSPQELYTEYSTPAQTGGQRQEIQSSNNFPISSASQQQSFPNQDQFPPQSPPSPNQTGPKPPLEDRMVKPGENPRGFKIFIIIAVIAIIAIYTTVTYLYIKNRKESSKKISPPTTKQETQTTTPTPAFRPEQIKIQNGNVVREKPGGEIQVIINKQDYESAVSITGFARVVVSPDKTKICFESWPPAPEPALYWSNIDGNGVVEVSPSAQYCMWSSDSMSIFYTNSAPLSTPVNIFKYDIRTGSKQNLTQASVPEGVVRRYDIVGLTGDSNRIICRYKNITSTTSDVKEGEEGACEINLTSGEVSHTPNE